MVKCDFCNSRAVAHLAYSGKKNFCKKHFIFFFEKRAKRTIREFGLLKGVKRLGIALSGGKDSLATLYLLAQLCKQMRISLTAICIDEGVAGYRAHTIKLAKKECKKLRVPIVIRSFKKEIGFSIDDVKKKGQRSACSFCGVFRRWLLNKTARELKLDKLATGHNLDDVAQTLFMNLMRNEPMRLARFGANGGILEDDAFVDRIRPLLRTPEKESALYMLLKGVSIERPECPYSHDDFLRDSARSFLNDCEQRMPGTKFKVLNSFLSIQKELNKNFKQKNLPPLSRCPNCNEPSSQNLCKKCEMVDALRETENNRA